MLEMFKYQFMQNAFTAGMIVGLLCSVLSVFVVLRKMSFIGQGIAHSAFGGVAFALLMDWDILGTTAVFCVLIAILIGYVSRKGKVSEDSSIGLFLTASMALGVILLKMRDKYTSEIFSYLFGDILAVSGADILKVALAGLVVMVFFIYYYRQLQFFTFDEEVAQVAGVPTRFLYYMLLIFLSITIVVSIQVVGVVLVSALLIIPATVALLVARRFSTVMLVSVLVGLVANSSGLIISYYTRFPSGAVIVLILFLIFTATLLIKKAVHGEN